MIRSLAAFTLSTRWVRVALCSAGVAAALAAGAVLWLRSVRSIVGNLPVLRVDQDHRDLGVVLPGTLVPVQYPIENTGTADLFITDLRSSCGCAPATLAATRIPPGGSTLLEVPFATPHAAGIIGQAVMFKTNDPQNPDIRLAFQVTVKRPVEAIPPNLFAGSVPPGGVITHDLELCATDGLPFSVLEIRPSVPWIELEPQTNGAQARQLFRVKIHATPTPRSFSESIEVTVNWQDQKRVVIVPVRGECVANLAVTPIALILSPAPRGSSVAAKLILNSLPAAGTAVREVKVADATWEVIEWSAEEVSGNALCVRLNLRVPNTPGYKRTTLTLRTTGEGSQVVPLSCLVRDKAEAALSRTE